MDRGVCEEPSAPGEPIPAYLWDPDDRPFARDVPSEHFPSGVVAVRYRIIRHWMDPSVPGSCVRTKGTGIFSRLALPVYRNAMVVGKSTRESVST